MKADFNKINTRTILFSGIVISIMFIIASMVMESIKDSYVQKILDARKQKDHFFRTSQTSPIQEKEKFEGLSYFEPQENFRVKAKIDLLKDTLLLNILRSDGKKDQYIRFAKATFKLNTKTYSLILLKAKEEGSNDNVLFLPFKDLSSGSTSYQGGRYIDIEYKNKKEVFIDFNQAYNPYCVYSYRYSCPLPPEENYLDAEITAGEKYFEGNAD